MKSSGRKKDDFNNLVLPIIHDLKARITRISLIVEELNHCGTENFRKEYDFCQFTKSLVLSASQILKFKILTEQQIPLLETVDLHQLLSKIKNHFFKFDKQALQIQFLPGQEPIIQGCLDYLFQMFHCLISLQLDKIPDKNCLVNLTVVSEQNYIHVSIFTSNMNPTTKVLSAVKSNNEKSSCRTDHQNKPNNKTPPIISETNRFELEWLIARKIAQFHKGSLEIKTSAAGVAAFDLFLPIQIRKERQLPAPSEGTNKIIMIVDDDLKLARIIQLSLGARFKSQITAAIAHDGEECLTFLKDQSPALIILDLMIPRISGFEILQFLKDHNKQIPVIIISSIQPTERIDSIGYEWVAGHFTKPIDIIRLNERVQQVINGKWNYHPLLLDSKKKSGNRKFDNQIDISEEKIHRLQKLVLDGLFAQIRLMNHCLPVLGQNISGNKISKEFQLLMSALPTALVDLKRLAQNLAKLNPQKKNSKKSFNLNDLLTAAQQRLERMYNCRIYVDFGVSNPTILGEPELFSRSIDNLIINAIEATPRPILEKQPIQISTRTVESSNIIQIKITDYGKGIPKALHHLVFSGSFSTKKNGLGIGLTIAKKGVVSHGGSISFESMENEGTTFIVHLPLTFKIHKL